MLGSMAYRGLGDCYWTVDDTGSEVQICDSGTTNTTNTSGSTTDTTSLSYCNLVPGACPGTGTGTTGSTSSSSTGTGFWAQLAAALSGKAANVLSTRYSVPQLNPGQYIATSPTGQTVMYQQPAGSSAMSIPGLNLSSGSMLPILLIGGVMVIMMMSRK